MNTKTTQSLKLNLLCLVLGGVSFAQAAQKPLTNLDLIKMVKGGVPETAIITTIQKHKTKFDVSPDGLIALHKAGVTQAEMDAIMAASGGSPAPTTTAVPVPAPPPPAPKSRLPVVVVVQNGVPQELPLEKTQLAQTKTKPSSMASLAGDSVVTQAMQAGVGTATMSVASHMNSPLGGATMQQAGSIFSGVMAHRNRP